MSIVGKVESLWRYLFFFQAEDGIRDLTVTGVQTCALPIYFDVRRAGLVDECARGNDSRTRATRRRVDARVTVLFAVRVTRWGRIRHARAKRLGSMQSGGDACGVGARAGEHGSACHGADRSGDRHLAAPAQGGGAGASRQEASLSVARATQRSAVVCARRR